MQARPSSGIRNPELRIPTLKCGFSKELKRHRWGHYFFIGIKIRLKSNLSKIPKLKHINTLWLAAGTGVDIIIRILNLGLHTGSSVRAKVTWVMDDPR